MIEKYLHTSSKLKAVFLLIDIRHDPSANDKMMYDWIVAQGYEPIIIATKLDKIKRSQVQKNVKAIKETKAAIKKAFQNQIDGKGFSLVEVVSTCPTNWGMTPEKALKWLEENMLPYYPLGVYKDIYAEEAK